MGESWEWPLIFQKAQNVSALGDLWRYLHSALAAPHLPGAMPSDMLKHGTDVGCIFSCVLNMSVIV